MPGLPGPATAALDRRRSADAAIEVEKKAALTEVKDLVASLSLEIAEKVLREKLSDDKSQKALVSKFIKDVKVN